MQAVYKIPVTYCFEGTSSHPCHQFHIRYQVDAAASGGRGAAGAGLNGVADDGAAGAGTAGGVPGPDGGSGLPADGAAWAGAPVPAPAAARAGSSICVTGGASAERVPALSPG